MRSKLWMLCVVALAISSSALADENRSVTLSGVTYVFNTPYPLAGVTVSIAEHPQLSAVSDAIGRYSLEVPDDAEVTPVASIAGFRTMHLQTFQTDGEDIERVFVQMVPLPVYDFLALMLGIDPAGPGCHIVSTVSAAALQGLSFDEFVKFGPQGVPGAIVSAKPALAGPIYFNEQTLPDPSLSAATRDGGVLFLNVPPGVHRLRATAAGREFAKVKATCAPGRFINASPPWGLRERR